MNQKSAASGAGLRLGSHWRLLSWAVLDKSLPLGFGLAFVLLVLRALPKEQFALQGLAAILVLTASQLLRSLCLVPLIRAVAESGPGRVASAGAWLYSGGSALVAVAMAAGAPWWEQLFQKADLAAVLLPSAVLLCVGSPRDAVISTYEAQRRLRTVFWLDAAYYALAVLGLVIWRFAPAMPRSAVSVQWVQAVAAGLATGFSLLCARQALFVRPGRAEVRRILEFGRVYLGSGFGATLSQSADQWVAGRLMDKPGLAAYLAAKMLFRGFNLVAQAMSQVLMPTVAKLQSERRVADLVALFEKSVCFVTLALVPICALLYFGTGWMLDVLLNGRYREAVPAFRILVLSALTLPIASVGSPFLTGLGRLRSLLWITWTGLFLGVGLAVWWIPAHGPEGAATATAVAAVYGMLARAAVLRRDVPFRLRGIVSRVGDAWGVAARALAARRARA